jgi:Penicillin binding protein transpeptidase domain/Penicillin-binding Protein dimerisation domain/NTF2-like N-terminal transpeptidase domain
MFYRASAENPPARLRRARPVIALAAVAFVVGAIAGASHGASAAQSLATRFLAAWEGGRYATMYRELDAASHRRFSPAAFGAAYVRAMRLATATRARVAGKARSAPGGAVQVPVSVRTRLFGTLHLTFHLTFGPASGGGSGIAWSRSLAFPGLHPGEFLSRRTALPPRATLLARDGTVLAEGPAANPEDRTSPLGALATAIVGDVGPVPGARQHALEAQGVPDDALVGTSGIEEALDEELRGVPGGVLLAVGPSGSERVLASTLPRPAPPLRTTVSPALQRAAVTALGGQLGGVVVLQPATGQVLAVAGIGLDSVQPPGSTFKMVTLTGVLEAGLANPHTVFPYATHSTLDGVKLNNANGEECGGTLELAFAVSCNSVFAPLGAKLGAERLVRTAEAFGFNRDPGIAGAAESTLPAPSQIRGELDVGSTAIGQGEVQASALEMAIVAATIADGGRRPRPTFLQSVRFHPETVVRAGVARTVRRLMEGVVRNGTGTSAAIPGVVVAGKTGTAELKTECTQGAGSAEGGESGEGCAGAANEASNTDAWFAAFAPAIHPRLVVAVLLVKDGAGGDTAAPVARQVLEAGLHGGI